MECNCTAQMINGIVYGVSLSVIIFVITYLLIDWIQERKYAKDHSNAQTDS